MTLKFKSQSVGRSVGRSVSQSVSQSVKITCILPMVTYLVCEVWRRVIRQISNSKGRFLTIDGSSNEDGSTTDKICTKRGQKNVAIIQVSHILCVCFVYKSPVLLPTHSCSLLVK